MTATTDLSTVIPQSFIKFLYQKEEVLQILVTKHS